MMRTSDPYSCLVDWSSSSMSLSLSLSLKSSSWLLDNSSWSFFFSVLAFSQALARVFSFCTMQQHTGTSSVTGTGSECFGGESAGCDRTAPSSRFPVVASIRTLRSPAPPVSPAKAPPQPHSPTDEMSNNTVSSIRYCLTGINTGRHLFPTHTFSSTFSADLVDLFKQLADFPLSGGVVIRRPEKKDNTSLAHWQYRECKGRIKLSQLLNKNTAEQFVLQHALDFKTFRVKELFYQWKRVHSQHSCLLPELTQLEQHLLIWLWTLHEHIHRLITKRWLEVKKIRERQDSSFIEPF